MIKVGKPGPPLPAPTPMALEKYTVTRKGETSLSDLYNIWKAQDTPVYNTTLGGQPIVIGRRKFEKGLGVRGESSFMFLTKGRADRLRALVALDPASKAKAVGRFRVYNEDFFANKVLWDSGKMTKDSPPKQIDIGLEDVPDPHVGLPREGGVGHLGQCASDQRWGLKGVPVLGRIVMVLGMSRCALLGEGPISGPEGVLHR
ncbi:MAG: hypothetical protein CMJ83_15410 [Planctomycetes bacterium]|nr:hypothetical protein [Planctomycetota bacterium]